MGRWAMAPQSTTMCLSSLPSTSGNKDITDQPDERLLLQCQVAALPHKLLVLSLASGPTFLTRAQ